MFPYIQEYLQSVQDESGWIEKRREAKLLQLEEIIRREWRVRTSLSLHFICTHNSRRSQFAAIWTSLAAHFLGLEGSIRAFSGGTESTAFHPNALAALERAGVEVQNPGGSNPVYRLYYSETAPPMTAFSKRFDDPSNPQSDFIAVMTCSEADENCPFVPGALHRFSLPYKDPKLADGSPEERQVYDARCRQIAREMVFLLSHLNVKDES